MRTEKLTVEQAIEQASLHGAKFDANIAKEALERSNGYPTLIE